MLFFFPKGIFFLILQISKVLYNLDSKPGGLLSKRGSGRLSCPLEIHCKGGLTFEGGGLTFGRGLTFQIIQ